MELDNLTKEQAIDFLTRYVELNEQLFDLDDESGFDFFVFAQRREIFLEKDAFYKVCEVLKLPFGVYMRNTDKYKWESIAETNLLGKDYKLFCIYDLEGEEE